MKRILGIIGTKRLLITGIAFATLGMVGSGFSTAIASGADPVKSTSQINARGGEITINKKSGGIVQLTSNRFTCESCAVRVIPKIKALNGVTKVSFGPTVGSSKHGPIVNGLLGTLTVVFDSSKITSTAIAMAAKHGLESDPYNEHPVRLVYRTALH